MNRPDRIATRTIYLDQFAFIQLARARRGKGTSRDVAIREKLLSDEVRANVAFPLSRVHYLETWKQGNAERRRELAREMAQLSRFLTIGHTSSILRAEVERAVRSTFDLPAMPGRVPVWGYGAVHAFGWNPPPEGWRLGDPYFEFLLLAGTGTDSLRHYKQERCAQERAVAESMSSAVTRLSAWRTAGPQRQRRLRLQALSDFSEALIPALIGAGIDVATFDALSEPELEGFLERIPTIWTLTELRRVRMANPQQGFAAHDLNDLRALALSLVYCDVVVMDKAWWDAVGRTNLASRFQAVALKDISDIDDVLSELPRGLH